MRGDKRESVAPSLVRALQNEQVQDAKLRLLTSKSF